MPVVVESIVEHLADNGIDHYFVVNGGAIAPFIDAVSRSGRAKYYCFQHEQSAAMAAEGYFRASGKIGVVLVTSGPGVQNIINGVCGCWFDSIPCLFVTGQVNMRESIDSVRSFPRQVGFQEMDVVSMTASCSKFSVKITTDTQIGNVFSDALSSAIRGRPGPVIVDFPVNFQMSQTPLHFKLKIDQDEKIPTKFGPSINKLLQNAERPLVILGNGARAARSVLKEWLKMPFVTSWGGVDLVPHDHPMRVGCIGVYGDRVANYAVQNADLLIILGSRLDTRQTGGNLTLCSRSSKRIMVDIDQEEINKLGERGFTIDEPVIGAVEDFIDAFTIGCPSGWIDTINLWKSEFGTEITRVGEIYTILENIELPDDCIIIPETGATLVWTMQSLRLGPGHRMFSNLGNSSMGWALPAAIGAAIATEGRVPVVCIVGDGGVQMNIQELNTLATLGLPVSVIVVNNSGYGIIRQFQDSYFKSNYAATSGKEVFGSEKGLDFVKIAEAYNVKAERTTRPVISVDDPVLFEVPVSHLQKIYPKLEFGNSLENMAPQRPELHKFMIVDPVEPISGGNWVK